jgi:hypothetical protein
MAFWRYTPLTYSNLNCNNSTYTNHFRSDVRSEEIIRAFYIIFIYYNNSMYIPLQLQMIIWSSIRESSTILELQQLTSLLFALLYTGLNFSIPYAVSCAHVNQLPTQSEILIGLCAWWRCIRWRCYWRSQLEYGGDSIEEWQLVRLALYTRLFSNSRVLSTCVTLY